MIVVNREAFWSINGFDERFIPGASGFDDTSFMLAAQTLLNTQRIMGTVYSFDHPESVVRDYGEDNPNISRYKLYEYANLNPKLMNELVKR
jgi:predicted glycosyltransferase involved in capsule biosynthesis